MGVHINYFRGGKIWNWWYGD